MGRIEEQLIYIAHRLYEMDLKDSAKIVRQAADDQGSVNMHRRKVVKARQRVKDLEVAVKWLKGRIAYLEGRRTVDVNIKLSPLDYLFAAVSLGELSHFTKQEARGELEDTLTRFCVFLGLMHCSTSSWQLSLSRIHEKMLAPFIPDL